MYDNVYSKSDDILYLMFKWEIFTDIGEIMVAGQQNADRRMLMNYEQVMLVYSDDECTKLKRKSLINIKTQGKKHEIT